MPNKKSQSLITELGWQDSTLRKILLTGFLIRKINHAFLWNHVFSLSMLRLGKEKKCVKRMFKPIINSIFHNREKISTAIFLFGAKSG